MQQAVDGLVGRVEVAAGRELLHPVAHVAEELVAELLALESLVASRWRT